MTDTVPRTRDNPEFDELSDLLDRARAESEKVARLLHRPAALMSQDRVWTGPTAADAFAADLEGRRSDLPRHLERFVDAIAERRAGVPPTLDIAAGGR